MFAINQKSSINQSSKNSKSKNVNQHMFAKSIRIVFSKNLFEKTIVSSYYLRNFFDIQRFSQIQNQIICKKNFRRFRRFRRFYRFHFKFLYVFTIVAFVMNCTHLKIKLSKSRILSIDEKKKSNELMISKRNRNDFRCL